MPCYEVNTFSTEFSPQNYSILAKAVASIGGTARKGIKDRMTIVLKDGFTITIDQGQASAVSREYGRPEREINALRVAYAKAILSQHRQWSSAKGWTAFQTSAGRTTFWRVSQANAFIVEALADGKIKITSPGGFSAETHADADNFLSEMHALAGGSVETKKLAPNLGNPHAHKHAHGISHSH